MLDSVSYMQHHGTDFNMQHRHYTYGSQEGSVVIVKLWLLITGLWFVHFLTPNNFSTSNTHTNMNTKTHYGV